MASVAEKAKARVHDDGFTIKGWSISAHQAPIIGDKRIEEYSKQLGNVLTLPEILFGDNVLTLTHEASGTVFSFKALDALLGWQAEKLPPLKVSLAAQWQASRIYEIQTQQAVLLEYDWTYTTPYQGTMTSSSSTSSRPEPYLSFAMDLASAKAHSQSPIQQMAGGSSWPKPHDHLTHKPPAPHFQATPPPPAAAAAAVAPAAANTAAGGGGGGQVTAGAAAAADAAGAAAAAPLEHTSSTSPAATPPPPLPTVATVTTATAAATVATPSPPPVAAAAAGSPTSPADPWQPSSHQIDRTMLMSQDEPILFYADIPLYESELDDNGVSQLGVKIRVMPRCWLVLLRFWLRVDGALVRLRETRLFCR